VPLVDAVALILRSIEQKTASEAISAFSEIIVSALIAIQ
jgi:hypothetical protein